MKWAKAFVLDRKMYFIVGGLEFCSRPLLISITLMYLIILHRQLYLYIYARGQKVRMRCKMYRDRRYNDYTCHISLCLGLY